MAKPAWIQELEGPTFLTFLQPSFLLRGFCGSLVKGPLESATALSSFLKENSLATSDTMAWELGGEGEASTPPRGVCVLVTTEREKE